MSYKIKPKLLTSEELQKLFVIFDIFDQIFDESHVVKLFNHISALNNAFVKLDEEKGRIAEKDKLIEKLTQENIDLKKIISDEAPVEDIY